MAQVESNHSTASTLNQVIGKEATQLLMQPSAYGGKTLDVPKGEVGRGEQAFAALAEVIGMAATQRLCSHFGGDRIYIPKGMKKNMQERNQRIVTAYNQGTRIRELVEAFDLTDRRIWAILKKTDMSTFTAGNASVAAEENSKNVH